MNISQLLGGQETNSAPSGMAGGFGTGLLGGTYQRPA